MLDLNIVGSIYYRVGDRKTVSKVQAFEWANNDITKIKFCHNEDQWKSFDWTVEPTETWDELLKERCTEIRNLYDHVCIWFSGGYDSFTIVDAFIKNGILIDELLIYGRDYREKNDPSNLEAVMALKYANQIKTIYPNLKITLQEFSGKGIINFYKNHNKAWIYHPGEHLWFSKTGRGIVFDIYKDLQIKNNNTKIANVLGHEKPRLNIIDGNWVISIPDKSCLFEINNPGISFYSGVGAEKIYSKQVWMMINWLESVPDFSVESLHKLQSMALGWDWNTKWNMAIGRYNLTDPVAIQCGFVKFSHNEGWEKTVGDKVLLDYVKVAEPSVYKIYAEGHNVIRELVSDQYLTSVGFVNISSDPLFVKKFNPKNILDQSSIK